MARGRGGHHKGGRRQFTNPDELNARSEREEREKAWRRNRGELEESESGEESGEEKESEESDEGDEARAPKGTEALIDVQNPNRIVKVAKKGPSSDAVEGAASSSGGEVQLSRREREELEKQRARENYMRLHAEGKTEQARADLARLALIRREREEAAKKREQERVEKDGASKTAAINKVAAVKSAVSEVTVTTAAPGLKKKTVKK